MNGRLIYVAHPFGSTNGINCDDVINSNQMAIDKIMKELVLKDRNNVYLSPLHNFSMLYFEKEYAKGLPNLFRHAGKMFSINIMWRLATLKRLHWRMGLC